MTRPFNMHAYAQQLICPLAGRCRCGNQLDPGQAECRSCERDAKGPFEFEPGDDE